MIDLAFAAGVFVGSGTMLAVAYLLLRRSW